MKIIAIIYAILTIVFFVEIIFAIVILEFVKQAISVKERKKLVSKIEDLKNMRKYSLVWPYVLYRLLRDDVS